MRFRTAAFITAAALVFVALPAAARGSGREGHGQGPRDHDRILHMAKELGLSAEQLAQIETITATHREGALGDARQSMRAARRTLGRTIHDTAATDDQVRDAAAAVATLETQSAVQRHQMAIEISMVLTDDQRAKLAELKSSFKDRRRGPPRRGLAGS